MITSIKIEGFRSIRSARIDLRPLNVLIGPNQSGKTNLLDALDFLSKAVQGKLNDSLKKARGGFSHIVWAGGSSDSISFEVATKHKNKHTVNEYGKYDLVITDEQYRRQVARELATTANSENDPTPVTLLRLEDSILRTYDPEKRECVEIQKGYKNFQEPFISTYTDTSNTPLLVDIRDEIISIRVYPGFDTKARWMCDRPNDTPQIRQPQFVQLASDLDSSGDNLVNVLYTLSQDREVWESFKEDIRIGFPDFENILFPPDAGQGRIAFSWVDRRFPKRPFPAEVLSAGTLSFLAYAALFAIPNNKGLICIDEPEANLHPELLYRFVGLMEKASARRQIIVVTHSDALLSYLSDPSDVVLVTNSDEKGTTFTRPPGDDLKEWLKTYTLGELRESGHLAAFAGPSS